MGAETKKGYVVVLEWQGAGVIPMSNASPRWIWTRHFKPGVEGYSRHLYYTTVPSDLVFAPEWTHEQLMHVCRAFTV